MNLVTDKYEDWIRTHLPKSYENEPIDCFHECYLDGLTMMQLGERGGPDEVVYAAEDEDDLRWHILEHVVIFMPSDDPLPEKTWRYYRDHAENGLWYYVEHRHYDYNGIEDSRLVGFEDDLRRWKEVLPPERWEKKVRTHVALMNRWFKKDHWGYDREKLCFIEISDCKEYASDFDDTEEPRPGSIIEVVD